MKKILFSTLILTQIILLLSEFTPASKCRLSNKNCLKAAAQATVPIFTAGIPELGIQPLDVMHVDKIDLNLAGLTLSVRNSTVEGLKDTVIENISIDMNKKQINLKYHCDVIFKGKYKASGKLLGLPIVGDGNNTIKLKHLEIELTIPFENIKTKDGKDAIDIKRYSYKFDVKGNAHFHLTNLFNGDKQLGDAFNKVMNDNWESLIHEFGRPVLEKPIFICYSAVKSYFISQPLDKIAEL